jgi:putative intracellular protease/amidase
MAKILIVTTSHGQMGETGHKTGSWVEEVAAPYYILKDGGVEVAIASALGGVVPFDPNSLKDDAVKGAPAKRFLRDDAAQRAVRESHKLAGLDRALYDGVFLPGGHGVMWDLPDHADLAALLEEYDFEGKIIAAVCHGPAGFVGARQSDGRALVAGRKVTGFSDAEEKAVGLDHVVPFLLETRLRELGGLYECAAAFEPHAVRDGFLMTGQNPMSSELVGEMILAALDER